MNDFRGKYVYLPEKNIYMSRKIVLLFALLLFYCAANAQTFNMPVFDKTDILELHIDKVEITKDTTYIYCTYTVEERSWANISRNTYLEDVLTNRKYPIVKTYGIPFAPDKKHFADPTEQQVVFCFPAIHSTKFDFIEDRAQKMFNIYGIELNKSYNESFSIYQLKRFQNMFDFYMSASDTLKALSYKEKEFAATEYLYGIRSIPLYYEIIESSGLFLEFRDYEKALYYRQKEFDIVKYLYNETDSSYMYSLQYLAYCYSLVGNYSESNSLFRKVSQLYSKALEISDDYIWVLDRLASNYLAEDSVEKAIEVLEKKMSIMKDYNVPVKSTDNISLITLASLYLKQGKEERAIKLYKEIAIILKSQSGDIDDYASFLYTTAKSFADVDSFSIAASLMQDVVDVRKTYLKHGDVRYVESLNHLAEYYSRLQRYFEAIQVGEETIQCLKMMERDDKRSLMIGINNLAQYYADVDSFDLARIKMIEAVKLQKELGVTDSVHLNTLYLLAAYCEKSTDYQTALADGKNVLQQIQVLEGKSKHYYNCLSHLIPLYEKADSMESAIALSEELLSQSNYLEGDKNIILHKADLAHYYSKKYIYDKAISIQEEVVSSLEKNEEEKDAYALNLSILSAYYFDNNHPKEALMYAKKSVSEFSEFKDERLLDYASVFLRNLANSYFANGNSLKSLQLHKESLHLIDSLVGKDHIEYAETMHLIAHDYAEMDSLIKAVSMLKEITTRWKQVHGTNSDRYVVWMNNLAYYNLKAHNYIEAIQIFEYVAERTGEIFGENSVQYSKVLNNLALSYAKLFDYSSAIELSKKALEIQKANTGELSKDYIKNLNNIGSYYMGIGAESDAVMNLEKALTLTSKLEGDSSMSYITTLNNLACTYGLSNKVKSIEVLNTAISICEEKGINGSLSYAQLLENRASYYNSICNYENAIKDCVLANKILLDCFGAENIEYALGLSYLAEYYDGFGDTEKAIHTIRESVGRIKKIYTNYHDRQSGSYVSMYWNLVKSLYFDEYPKIVAHCPNDSAVADLFDAILFAKGILLRKEMDNIRWTDIRNALKEDEIAIEFIFPRTSDNHDQIHGVYTCYALVLKRDFSAPRMVKLFDYHGKYNPIAYGELTWNPLKKEIEGVRNIYFSPISLLSTIPIENLSVGKYQCVSDSFNLYRLSSTREIMSYKKRNPYNSAILYGGLNYNYGDNVPSFVLSEKNTRSGFEPLYYSHEEVNNISGLLGEYDVHSQLYEGDNGLESSLKKLSGCKFDILHLATHAKYVEDSEVENEKSINNMFFIQQEENPFIVYEDKALTRSFLVMSGGNQLISRDSSSVTTDNDGYLTALEISKLDLSSVDLVTLSACESGQGDLGPDSGILGLQRGFKKAGAKSILMSTEKVDDEATSIFMTTFYKNLMNGQTKMQALKNAQKHLRQIENGKYYDLKYWASFILLDGLN